MQIRAGEVYIEVLAPILQEMPQAGGSIFYCSFLSKTSPWLLLTFISPATTCSKNERRLRETLITRYPLGQLFCIRLKQVRILKFTLRRISNDYASVFYRCSDSTVNKPHMGGQSPTIHNTARFT